MLTIQRIIGTIQYQLFDNKVTASILRSIRSNYKWKKHFSTCFFRLIKWYLAWREISESYLTSCGIYSINDFLIINIQKLNGKEEGTLTNKLYATGQRDDFLILDIQKVNVKEDGSPTSKLHAIGERKSNWYSCFDVSEIVTGR